MLINNIYNPSVLSSKSFRSQFCFNDVAFFRLPFFVHNELTPNDRFTIDRYPGVSSASSSPTLGWPRFGPNDFSGFRWIFELKNMFEVAFVCLKRKIVDVLQ